MSFIYDNKAVSVLSEMKDFFVNKSVTEFAVSNVFGQTFSPLIIDFVKNLIFPLISILFFKFGKNSLNVNFMGENFNFGETIGNIFIFIISMLVLFFVFVRPVNISIKKQEIKKQKEQEKKELMFKKSFKILNEILLNLRYLKNQKENPLKLADEKSVYF